MTSKKMLLVSHSLLWTLGVLWMLCHQARWSFAQWQTRDYAETRGTITQSELRISSDEGTSYRLDVTYNYRVGTKDLTGHVTRYDGVGSPARSYWEGLRSRFRPGTTVPVYFDARAPERAVLIRGNVELWFLVFMMPFVVLVLALWAFTWQAVRDVPANVLRVKRARGVTRVTLRANRAFAVALLWAFVSFLIALGGGFAVAPDKLGPNVTLLLLQLVAAPLLHWLGLSFERVIVLADDEQTLTLREGGDTVETCTYEAVRSLWVRERAYRDLEGDRITQFLAMLEFERSGKRRRVTLDSASERGRAEALCSWLTQQLKPPPPSAEARELDLPIEWRTQRGGLADRLAFVLLSALMLPSLLAMVCVARHAPQLEDLWALLAVAISGIAARPWWARLQALRKREVSLVYLDATGIGWGERPPPRAEPGETRGYVPFNHIAEVRYGCGPAADEIDLHLKSRTVCTLPRSVTSGPARHELVELLADEFPDVNSVECEKPATRR